VIPSRIESIPVVFSDALQLGTPVVSMPVGDLERIINEFRCGILAAEISPEALASALKEAAERNKDSFREGTAKAYEQFELRNAVDKWLRFEDRVPH
jgi:glycosyltransferase involved in cell wall biosynthesis